MDDFTYTPPAAGKASLKDRILGMDKKLLAIIGGAAALLIVAIILIAVILGAGGGKTNEFSVMEKVYNGKLTSYETAVVKLLNGADKNTVSKIFKILKQNEDFKDYLEGQDEDLAEMLDYMKDKYGDDVKVRIKNDPDSEDELDKEDLSDAKDEIKDLGKRFVELSKTLNSMKNSEKKDLAEELDISLKDLNKLIDLIKELGNTLKSAKITEGYELEANITYIGSELDEPEEEDYQMTVYKVNGKWVSDTGYSALYDLYRLLTRTLG